MTIRCRDTNGDLDSLSFLHGKTHGFFDRSPSVCTASWNILVFDEAFPHIMIDGGFGKVGERLAIGLCGRFRIGNRDRGG